MTSLRQTSVHGRRALRLVVGLVIVIGLIVVFAGTLTRSTDIETRAERARAEIAALEDRAAAGRAEVAFFGSDHFIRQQARALGFGEKGEVPFALSEGAPSPEPIEPIGPREVGGPAKAPLEAWVELLFGD